MVLIGAFALALALGAALLTIIAGFAGGHTRIKRYAVVSENGLYATAALIGVSVAILLWAFVQHDFSVKYVAGRSDSRMPLYYVLAAFYGGQEGSLLFWVFVSAAFGAIAAWFNRHRFPAVMPWFHGTVALGVAGFLLILNFLTNPFATYFLQNPPAEGQGLNPLLQTPLMTIHPPMLLSGFATAIVPFAFAMAALLARKTDARWLRATRRWTLISWLILGVGNILGGMWAYRELGWGGYWGWDAVENAALVPWLVGTAYVHSVIIQERRGMLYRWNALLVTLFYMLTLVGTWMTRSGLIDSVHTFAESDIGPYFFAQITIMLTFSVYVIATRWRDLAPRENMEHALSREGMFVFNNWVFLALAGVILYGTLFPAVAEMVVNKTISYGSPWYNRAVTPVGMIMLLVMALGTVMPWRHATWKTVKTQIIPPVLMTLVLTPSLIALYWFGRGSALGVDVVTGPGILAMLTFMLIVLNACILFLEFYRGAKTRSTHEGNLFRGLLSLFRRQRRRYGGYLAHIGVLMVFWAFLGNVLKVETSTTMRVGDQEQVGDYQIRFDGIHTDKRRDHIAYVGNMTLFRDGQKTSTLHPARYDYNDYTRVKRGEGDPMKVTSEIYIRSTPLEDVYIALLSFDSQKGAAAFHLEVAPFTIWFWLGGVMLILGVAVAAWPTSDPLREAWRRDVARRAVAYSSTALLWLLCLLPVALLGSSAFSVAHAEGPPVIAPSGGAEHGFPKNAPHLELPSDIDAFLHRKIPLTAEQKKTAKSSFSLLITDCTGCAGKTLDHASPSCVPTNIEKQQIRVMAAGGMNQAQILARMEEIHGSRALAIPQEAGTRTLNWLLPLLVIVGGFMLAFYIVVSRRKRLSDGPAGTSSHEPLDTSSTRPDLDTTDAAYLAQLDRELQESRG